MDIHNDTTTYKPDQVIGVFNVFSGKYPRKPKHTCKSITVIDSDGSDVKINNFTQRVWREREKIENGKLIKTEVCKGCLYDQTMRVCKQIESEITSSPFEDWGYVVISEKDFKNLRLKLNKRLSRQHLGTRQSNNRSKAQDVSINPDGSILIPKGRLKFIAFPQSDTELMVFHNTSELSTSNVIPCNCDVLFDLVSTTISCMPKASRNRKSQGFGLHYRGNKGDGRKEKALAKPIRLVSGEGLKIKKLLRETYGDPKTKVPIADFINLLTINNIGFKVSYGQHLLEYEAHHEPIDDPTFYETIPDEPDFSPIENLVGLW